MKTTLIEEKQKWELAKLKAEVINAWITDARNFIILVITVVSLVANTAHIGWKYFTQDPTPFKLEAPEMSVMHKEIGHH